MTDKKLHFIAGLIIAIAVGLPVYRESFNLFAGLWAALTSGIGAGAAKEYFDYSRTKGDFDWWDFAASCAGALVIAVFILMLHYGKG